MAKTFALMIVAFLLCFLGGCAAPAPFNITVSLDQSFLDTYKDRAIEVNVVALRNPESAVFEKDSMSAYWGNRVVKHEGTQSFTLDSKHPEKTISATDAAWSGWLKDAKSDNAPEVFFLVQLPGTWDSSRDQPGDLDPRRRIVTTNPKRGPFDAPPPVHLVIGKDRIWTQ